MSSLRVGLFVLVGLLLTFTIWVGWLNRASEKVAVNVPPAVLIALVGVLSTILFSLKPENQKVEFPIEFVVDPQTKQPFHCEFFDTVVEYSDPGYGTTAPTWQIAPEIATEVPALGSDASDAGLVAFYRSVLFRQILDVLAFTYSKSWDAQPTHWESATLRHALYRAASDPPRPGEKVDRAVIAKLYPALHGFRDPFIPFLHAPPSTRVTNSSTDKVLGLSFANPFATLEIALEDNGVREGVGVLRDLCRLDSGEEKRFRTITYILTVRASFSALRSGHPDMPSYKRWAAAAGSELERLGSERRWAAAKEAFLLRYAYRTESPMAEMKRKLLERVKGTSAAPGPTDSP